jgi:uncharacterized protein YktA (UPF0223 family)
MFNSWSDSKLLEYVEKLEEMYMQGVRQTTFKDKMLTFASTEEIEKRLNKAYQILTERGATGFNAKDRKKKLIRIQTSKDGFR